MPHGPRRIQAGDLILAAGCLLLLAGLFVGGAISPAPPASRREAPPDSAADGRWPAKPSRADSSAPTGTPAAQVAPPGDLEQGVYHAPDSRSIRSWKDLPAKLVHRPHWLTGAEHKSLPNGASVDPQLELLEFGLRIQGFDADSIKRGLQMVNLIDKSLRDVPQGEDEARWLLRMARGGSEAAALAGAMATDGGEEAIRVRAIALLAGRGAEAGVVDAVGQLAKADPSEAVRASAGVSLLWMKRQGEVADWLAAEASPAVVEAFFDSSRSAKPVLDPNRPPSVLVFRSDRMVDSSPLVDVLMEGTAASRWPTMTQAKMYSAAAWFGRERRDVADWMIDQYGRATSDFMRASILFYAPEMVHSGRLEDRAIEVALAGVPGLLTRTAVSCLSRFETERSMRTLMEVLPRAEGSLAQLALHGLVRFRHRHPEEVGSFLARVAESHGKEEVRKEVRAALRMDFEGRPH